MKRKSLLFMLMLALGAPWAAWAQTSFTLNQNITQELSPGSYSFYDSGGSSGNYSNSESYTATFTAPGPITINFSSFATESSSGCYQWDYMYIYDGTTSGTQLARGQTGCSSATLATSTNYTASSGTMTITWHSDGTTVAAGWEATITVAFQSPSDGFESGGWNTVNGSCTNKWYIGAPGKHSGSNGLFISNDSGSSNAYSTGSVSVVYAYKNVTLDAGTYNLTFDLKQYGESTWDCVGAMLYDNATTPSASTSYGSSGLNDWPSGYSQFIVGLGYAFSGNKWKTSSTNFTVETAGTYKLSFCWKNDGSGGSQTPAAIDNVCLKKVYDVTASVSPSSAGTATISYTYDFNDGSFQGWSTFGNDSDDYSWMVTGDVYDYTAFAGYSSGYSWGRSSTVGVVSGSYINNIGALSPDNYLVSPQIQLGGSITFYAKSFQAEYPEHIGVAVSTNGTSFTTIQDWDTPGDTDFHQYTVSLSGYSGLGYVAIRNFNTNDQYMVVVDDITITEGSATSFSRVLPGSASGTVTTTATGSLTYLGWEDNGQMNNSTSYSYAVNSANHSLTAVYESAPTTVPYAETFESNDHGWILLNGSCTNKWVRGSNGAHDGNNGLFITSDGNTNTYNNGAAGVVYAYRSITFDAAGTYNLSFDLRQQGESTYDNVGAMLYSSSSTPSPGTQSSYYGLTQFNSGYSLMIGGAGISQSGGNWVTISWDFDVSTSGTYKLVLAWKNDGGGGTQPPASIDNVKVQRFVTISASANPAAGGNVTFLTGDGGTTTNSYLPCYSYYNYNHSQQIYTPADIGAVGTINSIAFYNGGSTKTLTSFDVYMVHTGKAEFSSTSDWIAVTSGDLVYSGTNVEMTAEQWITLTLSNSFTYNGTSNLAIVICEYMSYSSGLACRVYTPSTGGYCSLYQYNDDNAYDPTNPSGTGTRLTVKNQILFNPFDGNLTRVFPTGTFCTFIEEPNTDYHFEDWTENGSQVSTNEVYTISNIAANHTVVANFTPNTHTLTASVNPSEGGTISDGNNNISGATTYNHGTSVTLTPTPATGYDFVNWTVDGTTQTGSTYTVTMDQDHTVVANFQLQSFTVTVLAEEGGTATGGGNYNYGATANIEAIPDACHTFSHFVDDNNAPIYGFNPLPIGVDHDMTITAVFNTITYAISASAYDDTNNTTGGGTVSGDGTLDCGSTCTLVATPATNYVFDNWTENGTVVSTSATYSFTVDGARTLVAHFHLDAVNITATAYDDSNNAAGGGTISGTGNIAIGTTCNLVATPGTGYEFVRWTENGSEVSTNATYSFTVSVARTLVAHFRLMDYTLTLAANPQAGGTVSANPAGPYHYNDVVTISATAATGYTFTSWSDNGTQSHTVTINGNDSYTANFSLNQHTVTYAYTGTVPTGAPAVPAQATYYYGDAVPAAAVPTLAGYTFSGWVGEVSTMPDNDVYVTGSWTANDYTLTLVASPTAGGTVSASPSQAYYHYGDQVTITATANSGYTFGSWSDGGAAQHTVTINSDTTFTAYFGADHTLITYADPIEGGYVTIAPVSNINAVTVGTGTTGSTYVPFSTAVEYSFVETLYTSSELGSAGTITSISYELNGSQSSSNNEIEVYLVHTSKANFSNSHDFIEVTANDKVFEGTWNIPGSGWATIVLDKPFQYNGTDNLMIGINEKSSGTSARSFNQETVSYSRVTCYGSVVIDPTVSNFYNGAGLDYSRGNQRANVRLGFGTYHYGQSVTLTAHANEGYQFVNWTENNQQVGTAGNATYTVTMDTDHTIYAHFERALKRFVTDGYWNVAGNWDPVGVPTPDISEDISIEAHAIIPDGVVAYADSIRPITHANSSITIKDGGQLVHNSAGLSLTAEKDITGYTIDSAQTNWNYYLFSSPVIASATYSGIETTPHYDLYSFDASNDPLEWILSTPSDIAPYTGFIYASRTTTTITVSGTVPPSNTTPSHQLDYTSGRFIGWNLIGNPFVCNAYVTRSGNNIDYYVLNHQSNYDEFIARSSSDTIVPLGALMVKASASGQSVTYSRSKSSKGPGILNIDVRRTMERGSALLDRARVRFGEGDGLEKFQFNPNHTKVYIPDGDKDFAVYYAQGSGTIPVNFKAESNGHYTLDFSTEDVGFNYIHLIDNMNGNDVDLLKTPYYSFDARSTDYASRFTIVFATGDSNDGNFAFYNNGLWIINNDGEATLQVVDALGRILSSETISGSCSKAINAAPGVYMLRLINGNDVKVQKIVVRR